MSEFKYKFCKTHFKVAETFAQMSYSKRKKVGAVLVTPDNTRILLTGYNGTLPGFDNICEKEVFSSDYDKILVTLPEVIHAEENIIAFSAKHGISTLGCNLYTTLSPCIMCAKLIINSGIKRVFYKEKYRDTSGLELLEKAQIEVIQYEDLYKYGI